MALTLPKIIFLSVGLIAGPAYALQCPITIPPKFAPRAIEDGIELSSDYAEIEGTGLVFMSGQVELRYADRMLGSDTLSYDRDKAGMNASGEVRYMDPTIALNATVADFDPQAGHGAFTNADFYFLNREGHGSAERIELDQTGTSHLHKVRYTSCPAGRDDWFIQARDIDLNVNTDTGYAHNAWLSFKGVPFLYLPYLSFPLSDTRKTGWLTPNAGSTSTSGFQIAWPWYWNIAPNYDLTLTPRILSRRGIQGAAEFRFLHQYGQGDITAEYIPHDNIFDDDRYQYGGRYVFEMGPWFAKANIQRLSDSLYHEQLGSALGETARGFIQSSVAVGWRTPLSQFELSWHNYELLGNASRFNVQFTDRPTERLPTAKLNIKSPAWGPAYAQYTTDAVQFRTQEQNQVLRWHNQATLGLRWQDSGYWLDTQAGWMYTQFSVSDQPDIERDLPFAKVDAGLIFERHKGVRSWTIEPRLIGLYIPSRMQDDIPISDTNQPDLSRAWLLSDNRFSGSDRINDAQRLTLWLQTRQTELGQERFSLGLGQSWELAPTEVALNTADSNATPRRSELLTEVQWRILERLHLTGLLAVDHTDQKIQRGDAALSYQWNNGARAKIGWRQRSQILEQAEIQTLIPFSDSWRVAASVLYSLPDDATLEHVLAAEYKSCCWSLQLAGRRYVQDDGKFDTSIHIQLELTGLGPIGDSLDSLLNNQLETQWQY